MKNIEAILTVTGTFIGIIAIGRYVYQIFKMSTDKRTDFKNLVMPKGSFWKHGNNIVFLMSALLIILGHLFT